MIIGYSGHAYVVIDAALKSGINFEGYTEKAKRVYNPFKLDYLGFESGDNFEGWNKGYEFLLGIGDNRIREKVTDLIISKGEKIQLVIHPSANIGSHVEIGDGTFVALGAKINPLAQIGKSAIVNTGTIIEHECQIGNYSHIAPGVVLAGNVKVGNRSFIGANAVVKEGVEIGDNVIIGAGTVVLNDVVSKSKMVGNPGRLI